MFKCEVCVRIVEMKYFRNVANMLDDESGFPNI